jgi:hypothetical protein
LEREKLSANPLFDQLISLAQQAGGTLSGQQVKNFINNAIKNLGNYGYSYRVLRVGYDPRLASPLRPVRQPGHGHSLAGDEHAPAGAMVPDRGRADSGGSNRISTSPFSPCTARYATIHPAGSKPRFHRYQTPNLTVADLAARGPVRHRFQSRLPIMSRGCHDVAGGSPKFCRPGNPATRTRAMTTAMPR